MADLGRDELMARAQEVLEGFAPGSAEVYFKFTCVRCTERCTLIEPNKLYERGECHRCGYDQPILMGGFDLHVRTNAATEGE